MGILKKSACVKEHSVFSVRKIMLFIIVSILFISVAGKVNAKGNIWVLDESNLITEENKKMIERLNTEVFPSMENKPELVVEVLNSIPEEYGGIDDYRNKRFEELGVGDKDFDSGVLAVISLEDKEFGIETGYGIEGILPDIAVSNILKETENHMRLFRDTNLPEHLNNAVYDLASDVSTELADGEKLEESREMIIEVYERSVPVLKIVAQFSLILLIFEYVSQTIKYIKESIHKHKNGSKVKMRAFMIGYLAVLWAVTWVALKVLAKVVYFLMRVVVAFGGGSTGSGSSRKHGGGRSGGGGASGGW